MNTIKKSFILTIASLCLYLSSQGQTINWATMQNTRHIGSVFGGYDYGFNYGIAYGYHLKSKLPIVIMASHAQPAGEKVFDDFKTKAGVVVRVYEVNNFQFAARVQGIFRRFENQYVTMLNFGSDLSATAGYYKPSWFVAGEFGFDKAIVTNFQHTNAFRENFPDVKDGWYQPATGGNFYYGIQTGYSFGANDITLNAGKVIQQDFRTDPTIPFYIQVGYNRRF
jgi:hypothetical protein